MDIVTQPPAPGTFRNPTRILNGFVTGAEARALKWLAYRMPAHVNSDHLTVLAITAMFAAGLSYWLTRWTPAGYPLAILFLALNWFGDSLDGTLARVRNRQRPRYGFYVDHVLDAFGAAFIVSGLALSGHLSVPVAAALLAVYFMLNIEILLATHCLGTFRMSFLGFGATELRIVLSIGTVRLALHPTVKLLGHEWQLFDVGGVVAALGMLVVLVVAFAQHTRRLYKLEPIPR